MKRKKVKEQMNIVTAVWFGRLLKCVSLIAMARIAGSMVMLTSVVNVTRDGTSFIPILALSPMLESNGLKATVETLENGND
jgi:hypothetical protein